MGTPGPSLSLSPGLHVSLSVTYWQELASKGMEHGYVKWKIVSLAAEMGTRGNGDMGRFAPHPCLAPLVPFSSGQWNMEQGV